MIAYGGLGGVWGGRDFDPDDAFEAAVARALNLSDDDVAEEMWGALANQPWRHENGDTADYSMRAAGDLVAAVRGVEGEDYCKWYCSAPEIVTPRIAEALAREGWRPFTKAETDAWYDHQSPSNLWDTETLKKVITDLGPSFLTKIFSDAEGEET